MVEANKARINSDVATIPIDFAIVPEKTDIENGLVISDVANDTDFLWSVSFLYAK